MNTQAQETSAAISSEERVAFAVNSAVAFEEKVAFAVKSAVASYANHHPDATAEALEAFKEAVTTSIIHSVSKKNGHNSPESRKLRLQKLRDTADINAVTFVVDRNVEPVFSEDGELSFKVSGQGGHTYAYQLDFIGNVLHLIVSMAQCRSDENFDALLGKEIALSRLIDEEVFMEIPLLGSEFALRGINAETLGEIAHELFEDHFPPIEEDEEDEESTEAGTTSAFPFPTNTPEHHLG